MINIDDPKRKGDRVTDLRSNQRMGATFLHFAVAAADDERGGRFKPLQPNVIVGAEPVPYSSLPPLPATSPWAHDFVPPEKPLGYRIDDGPRREPTGSFLPVATDPASAAAPLVEGRQRGDVGSSFRRIK
jgi:hypothetical protein